jgi:hypothetical protein
MNSGQAYVDSDLTVGMLNNTLEEVLLPTNYEGLLMTESPKGDGAFDTIDRSPKDRTPGVQESLMMQGLL